MERAVSRQSNPLSMQIKKQPLERQAADVLRDRILSGDFPPGYRLVETQLAEQIGLSRGTIRGALSELVHEGLVEQVAYTRWEVPGLSNDDAWELYTLRSALEGLGARLAAERIDSGSAERVRRAFTTLAAAAAKNDRGRVTEEDFALHKLIIELSGHRRLHRQYTVIEQQIRRYIACSNALTPDPKSIVQQHEPLVSAILTGRASAAEREAREHNVLEGKLLVDELREKDAKALKLIGGGRRKSPA
jgi:DNA-binding GntR family transcriptional regulator